MKSNAEIYIEKFKELEALVRKTYKLRDSDSISYYLANSDKFKNYHEEIKYCQDIRNLLQHKKRLNDSYPIQPAEETIQFIDSLIERVMNRKKCNEICIRFKDIYYCGLEDRVKFAMDTMKKNVFTCVPIIEDRKVIGVFDENSLFEYVSNDGIIEVDTDLRFSNIRDYLSLENREMEEFLFYKSTDYVEDLVKEFEKSFKSGKRISVVFLTPNGKKDEGINGIITAWDILGYIK